MMQTRGLTLGLHSEIWEDKEKKEQQNKIEAALELEGIQYISNPRPNQRGGGAAITGPTSNVRISNVRMASYHHYFTAS